MQIVTGLFLMFYDLLVQIAAKLRKTGRILRKHALYALRGILLCFWNEEEY